MAELKEFKPSDITSHKDAENGMYIIIDDGVYDVTGSYPLVLALFH